MKDFVKIGIKRKKIHSNHSEVPELFQKNVLGIIEGFTKTGIKRKKFRQTIVKWLRFQKNCPWYYVDNFFIEVAKTLPLYPLLYIRFHGKQQKIQ